MGTALHAVASPEEDSAPILTLTKVRGASQATQQYTYDPAVIDKAVQLGDMKQMSAPMRVEFYRAVCLSVGLNPLTQPFTVLERQDKTTWLYPNSTAAQQLAALHKVSYSQMTRRHEELFGEPIYTVEVTASLPDGRSVPAQGVVSLTKKKLVQKGTWPSGDAKFLPALDADGENILIPLRGDALVNAIMKCDSKALRRATLALVGLGWMLADFEGKVQRLNLVTGGLTDTEEAPPVPLLDQPQEQAKTQAEHIADLCGDPVAVPTSPPVGNPPPSALADAPTMDHAAFREAVEHLWHEAGLTPEQIEAFWGQQDKRFKGPIGAHAYPAFLSEQRSWLAKRLAERERMVEAEGRGEDVSAFDVAEEPEEELPF